MQTSLHPEWLDDSLPVGLATDAAWTAVIDFFLVHSPCNFQSNRKTDLQAIWKPGLWASERYLKRYLNVAIWGSNFCDLHKVKKADMGEAAVEFNLLDGFCSDLDRQVAIFTEAPNKGNSSVYMSFFYHVRNALAHARFAVVKNDGGRRLLLFEDGIARRGNDSFELSARGRISLESLSRAVQLLVRGPDEFPDIGQLIIDAISAGFDTKKKIKEELELSEEDWRVYSQVLREEGRIVHSKNHWSVTMRQLV